MDVFAELIAAVIEVLRIVIEFVIRAIFAAVWGTYYRACNLFVFRMKRQIATDEAKRQPPDSRN